MTREDLKGLLDSQTNDEFVDRELFDRRPWIFGSDEEHSNWRSAVAQTLNLHADQIRIVGSAATGYSLSPLKAGRPFRRTGESEVASDIDVALTSDELFTEAWNAILSFDRRRRLGLPKDERTRLRVNVYWGVVAQRSLPENTEPARRMLTALSVAGRTPPIRGHVVRCRIYRRIDDLRAYHFDSLRQLREELEE